MDFKTLNPEELEKLKGDRNIRIAPTFPPIEDIRLAINVLATRTQLVSIDKLVAEE